MDDVKIKLTPEIDTSKLDKDMDKVAKDSKAAVTKSMNELASGISNAMKMASEDMNRIENSGGGKGVANMFKRAAEAVQIFNERSKEIRGMENLDAATARLYALESSLSESAQGILKLQGEWQKLVENTDLANALNEAYGSLDGAKKRVEELSQAINQLTNETSGRPFNLLGDANKQMQELDKAREHLKALYAERKEMENSPNKGTAEWEQHMQLLNQLIPIVTQKVGTLANEFYATARKSGFGETKEEIRETVEKMNELNAATKEWQAAMSAVRTVSNDQIWSKQLTTDLAAASSKFDKILKLIQQMSSETQQLDRNVRNVDAGAQQGTANFSQWRNAVWSISRLMGSVYTISLDIVRSVKMIANFYKTIYSYVRRVVNAIKNMRSSIKQTMLDHIKSWAIAIKNVLRYAFSIRSLFALFRRLKRYIKEAFEEMAKQIPEVNKTLSELKSSLGMLKGSLGTAFEPIISAAAPLLNLLIEKLSTALTYVGMFFAALTGRGYVYKATKSMQDFAKATKEANKQLQGFDELNNLTTQKDSGADEGPMAIFKKVDIPDWIKKIADYIKELWNKLIDPIKKAWARIGDYVKAAWRRAFYNVKALLMDIIDDFFKAWSEKGQDIAEHFFEIVGDVGNIIANIAEALRKAWKYEDNGYKIWKAILNIIDKILVGVRKITLDIVQWTHNIDLTPAMTAFRKWLESLEPVVEMVMDILYDLWNDALKPILTWAFDGENSGIARFFTILKDFNDRLDKTKIRENLDKIWQALGRFGQTVGEGLLEFIQRISDKIVNWTNSDKFEAFCDKVVEFLDSIEPGDIADRLEQILNIIGNILESLWKAIQYVKEFNFMGKDALDWIEYLSENLETIAKLAVFGKLAIDIGRFIANIALFLGAIYKFLGVNGLIAVGVMALIGAIAGAIVTFVDMWRNGMDTVKVIIFGVFTLIATIITALIFGPFAAIPVAIAGIVALVVLIIKEHWEDIKTVVKIGIEAIKAWFINLGNSIKQHWEDIKTAIKLGIDVIKMWVTNVINSIKERVEYVKAIIKMAIDYVKTFFVNAANAVKQVFVNIINWIIEKLNLVINKIKSVTSSKGFSAVVSVAGGSPVLNALNSTQSTRSVSTDALRSAPVPGLAKGAVIPPNNEFLAVLGDQKRGTNIESPLSTMVEAFNQAGGNKSAQELTLLQEQNQLLRQLIEKEWSISASQMFSAMQRQAVVFTKQSGKPAF